MNGGGKLITAEKILTRNKIFKLEFFKLKDPTRGWIFGITVKDTT